MTASAIIMLAKIGGVFCVLAAGWVARRRGVLTDAALHSCSRFTLDVALPCLIFTKLLATVRREELFPLWYIPLAGAAIVVFAEMLGRLAAWRGVESKDRATFVMACGFPNWLYLALAVLEPLYGAVATRTLVLVNMAVHAYLWTGGIAPFRRDPEHPLRTLGRILMNPAFIATAAGVAVICVAPASWIERLQLPPMALEHRSALTVALWAVHDAMDMIGSLAIPLNLALVGAQLAYMPSMPTGGKRLLARVVLIRLLVAPAATGALMALAVRCGWAIPPSEFAVLWLMSAMPTAVVCSLVTEVYDGNTPLAARSIAATTLLSAATLPLWTMAAPRLYAWASGG